MLEREVAKTYVGWFRTLADPTRVQILNLLAEAGTPMSVGRSSSRSASASPPCPRT